MPHYMKVKGRGYLADTKINYARYIYDKLNRKYERDGQDELIPVFKRDIKDIEKDFIFDTPESAKQKIVEIQLDKYITDKNRKVLDKAEIVEVNKIPIKKRYLKSYVELQYNGIKTSEENGKFACNMCGMTICVDEPYVALKGRRISCLCLHCVDELDNTTKTLREKMDEDYKTTWLLERVSREI